MDERVEATPSNNWVYKFFCLMLFRRKKKLTYKELYLILLSLNDKRMDHDKCRTMCLMQILKIYSFNNNRLPENVEEIIKDGI